MSNRIVRNHSVPSPWRAAAPAHSSLLPQPLENTKSTVRRVLRPLGILLILFVVSLSTSAYAHGTKSATVQTGKATWYGPKFHGRKTASGERFDMHDLTAAHPSLPLGTVARITNLDNGRSIKVEINDRGPAKWSQRKGNVIDLSLGAAKKLGFVKKGRTRVKINVVDLGDGRRS